MTAAEVRQSIRLPFSILAVSLLCHFLAATLRLPADQPSRESALLLLAVSAGLDVGCHVVRRIDAFRPLHAARLLCLAGIFLLVGRYSFASLLALSAPYLVETPLFDENRVAAIWNGIAVAAFGAAGSGMAVASGDFVALATAAVLLLSDGLVAFLAQLAILHRELNVRQSAEVRDLSAAVNNLVDANMAFQLYAHNIESESTEKELQRITRELHDMIGYALTNVIVMMDAAPLLLKDEPETIHELFQKIRAQAEEALNETRRILRLLRDFRPFEPLGLHALAHLARSFQGATGINVVLSLGNLPWSFGREIDEALFRLVQASLTNAFRHGKATRVRISLWMTRNAIQTSVADNGRGVPSGKELVEGIGITGMRERLSAFGGEIVLRNLSDGFELLASIPYSTGGIGGTNQSPDR